MRAARPQQAYMQEKVARYLYYVNVAAELFYGTGYIHVGLVSRTYGLVVHLVNMIRSLLMSGLLGRRCASAVAQAHGAPSDGDLG